jgi:hypothetical protein
MRYQQTLSILLSSLFICFFAAPAFSLMSIPMGWYLEGNLGSTNLSNTNYNGSTSSSGIGGNGNFGYKFMPYFALEMGYSQYANTSIKTNSGTKAATVKYYSYDLAARGILPIIDSGFELFAKVGVQRLNAHFSIQNTAAATSLGLNNTHHSATGAYYGAGGQYYFMPELAAVAQWQRAQGNSTTGTMDLYTLGLSFIFD